MHPLILEQKAQGRIMDRKGIVFIDMHIRDERVLAWLKAHSNEHGVSVTHAEIAVVFGCHRKTVEKILKRLAGARQIQIVGAGKRGSYSYIPINERAG